MGKPENWKEMAAHQSRRKALAAVQLADLAKMGRRLLDSLPDHWHDEATTEFRDAIEAIEREHP